MKKVLLILALLSVLVTWPLVRLLAANPNDTVPELTGDQTLNIIKKFVDWLFTFLVIIASIAIVIAAFYFVTAGGDASKVDMARKWVIYALIGVVVALLSRGLVAMVQLMVK